MAPPRANQEEIYYFARCVSSRAKSTSKHLTHRSSCRRGVCRVFVAGTLRDLNWRFARLLGFPAGVAGALEDSQMGKRLPKMVITSEP